MIRLPYCLALILPLLLWASAASAHELSPEQLRHVGFRQHVGDSIPLDLSFTDDYGNRVALGDYFASRPVILTLNYFHCQNMCSLELQNLVDGLNGVPFTLGDQYALVTVSIDSRETPQDAATAKFRAMRGYIYPEAAAGWHLLTTTDQSAIDQLTQAVGFDYAYDAQEDDYAHPLGVVVLTPTAQISRYLYGLDYSANDLRLGLVDAAARHIGSAVDQLLLICYHYDAVSGRYTPLVMNLLGAAAGITVLLVGTGLFLMWRADLRRGTGDLATATTASNAANPPERSAPRGGSPSTSNRFGSSAQDDNTLPRSHSLARSEGTAASELLDGTACMGSEGSALLDDTANIRSEGSAWLDGAACTGSDGSAWLDGPARMGSDGSALLAGTAGIGSEGSALLDGTAGMDRQR